MPHITEIKLAATTVVAIGIALFNLITKQVKVTAHTNTTNIPVGKM